MIVTWMLYATACAAVVGLGALAVERALQLWALPQRWVWLAALAASLLVPLAAPSVVSLAGDDPAPAPVDFPVLSVSSSQVAALDLAPTERADGALWGERAALGAWLLASLAVAGWLTLSAASLRGARRRWRRAVVDGYPVLVSGTTGPAVVGCLHGEVVLPAWVLEWDDRRRRLIVAHEREHLRARDPMLLMAGWIAIAIAPWSLPVWWQVHRLRLAVEVDCDRRVLRGSGDVRDYGSLLLEVGHRSAGRWMPVAAFSEPRRTLERRIRMITWKRPRNRAARALAALAAAALVPAALAAIPVADAPGVDRLGALLPARAADPASPEMAILLPIQQQPVLWVTGGDEFRVGRPDGPVLRDDQLDGPLAELRQSAPEEAVLTVRFDTLSLARPGMAYSAIMAAQAACRAGFAAVLHEMVKRVPKTGDFRSIASQRQPLARPCEGSGARDTARAERPVRRDTVPGQPGFAYEVSVLSRKPELINKAEIAGLLQRSYPRELHDAGVGGQVVAQFVIQADGTVDPASLKSVSSSHAAFTEPTLQVVRQFRFRPGEYQGRPVRTLIQMPITWQPQGVRASGQMPNAVPVAPDFRGVGGRVPVGDGTVAYEVAVLETKPELTNKGQVASLMERLYPRMLADAGVGGQTVMQFVIEADGSVNPRTARVISTSNEMFGEASTKLVERFQFRPGTYGGQPVRVLIQMPITWQVPERVPVAAEPAVLGQVISGTVKDSSGRPVPGATVVIPALTRGTVTNPEGQYRLTVPAGTHSVQILAPGAPTPVVRTVEVQATRVPPPLDVTVPAQ